MIFEKIIPVFFWPTTVVFIDDDPEFLQIIPLLFKNSLTVFFENPNEGIKYINENYYPVSIEEEFVYNDDDSSEKNFFAAINSIHNKIYKNKRFNEILVVIIDYAMPQGNGLSFVAQIEQEDIKKILLTGAANNEQVVAAFNKGKIDKYIKKLGNDYDLQLRDYTNDLQIEHFTNLTLKLVGRNEALKGLLENKIFIQFFTDLIQEKEIVEFYLIDENGSFLTVDIQGKLNALLVQSEDVIEGIIKIYVGKEGITNEKIGELRSKRKMIAYPALRLIEENIALFDRYLLNCDHIAGTNIYYSFSSDVAFLNIDYGRATFANIHLDLHQA